MLGVPVATDPVSALEGLLDEANGNVIALRDLVRSLDCGTSDGKDTETLVSRFGRHPFVEMYDAERDRLGKIAKECAALGLEERRIHVAERESRALEAVLARVFDVLGLDTGQRARAGEVAAAELRAITVTPTARSAFELEARASSAVCIWLTGLPQPRFPCGFSAGHRIHDPAHMPTDPAQSATP